MTKISSKLTTIAPQFMPISPKFATIPGSDISPNFSPVPTNFMTIAPQLPALIPIDAPLRVHNGGPTNKSQH